jgi:bacteriocin biosynthesis cyclodehydratase domain-containing protein
VQLQLLQPLLLLQLLQPLLVSPAGGMEAVPERPALAPWYRLVADGSRTMLEHAGSVVTLDGRAAATLLPALLPLLDGTRTVEQLVSELGAVTEPAVANALGLLARHGLLLNGPPGLNDDNAPGAVAAALFVASTTRRTSPREARAALAGAEVVVAGAGAAAPELAGLLGDAGVGTVRKAPLDAASCNVVAAVPAADEVPRLDELNSRCLAGSRPWLQVLPGDGRVVVVGPLFLPGLSACHVCYRLRRGACSDFEDDFEAVEATPSRAASPRALVAAAAGIAALLLVRWLAARDPSLPGRFYALETGAILGLSHHHVLRVPRCPACGDAEPPLPAPWYRETAVAG